MHNIVPTHASSSCMATTLALPQDAQEQPCFLLRDVNAAQQHLKIVFNDNTTAALGDLSLNTPSAICLCE